MNAAKEVAAWIAIIASAFAVIFGLLFGFTLFTNFNSKSSVARKENVAHRQYSQMCVRGFNAGVVIKGCEVFAKR